MAQSITHLQKIQIGEESTKGTLVPATQILRGDFTVVEEQDFYRSPYPAGVRATVGGAGVILRKGVRLSARTELTFEEILWVLHAGIKGNITPSVANTTENTWAFAPELTTGIPTLDAATLEWIEADGSTNHIAREAGYGLVSQFGISWGDTRNAELTYEMFARASQTSTPTGSLTAYTGREVVKSALGSVYLDTSYAGMGGTQLAGTVRSGTFACQTGIAPDYTTDGRADLDFVQHKVGGPLTATLNLVMELNATGAARVANFRANDLVYVRVKFTGSTIASNPKVVQVDGAYRFSGPPSYSNDGSGRLVSLPLEAVYDTTGTKMIEFSVCNALTTI